MASKPPHTLPHKTVNVVAALESKLLRKGPFDAREELESSLHESYASLQSQLTPSYQVCTHTDAELLQLNQALIYGILTQQQAQQSLIMHLAAVTRDGYACFVSILLRLVNECYPKLLDQPRRHLLWLVRQLISLSASKVDTLCLSLLRRIVGGDVSQWNVWLAGQMLDILHSNWSWLVGHSGLLTNALFTFLRLLPDHFMAKNPLVNELKQNEATFCVKILRECFQDCLVIGRDLVRLLQDVACIPEFESVWRDLLSNPSAFNTVGFADIAQLYVVRTPSRYLASRLTPEMEAQIRFMLTYVRMGNQQRYQAWFAQRFLAAPGSETLVCDLIRFICCAHHPTNQILQSDIVPRWAVLGWLLTCCRSHHVEANAKLSLFFDWLFYMRKTDNIMNIEPAMLLMVYSIPKYMDITHSLLEFLFLCMEHYDPHRKDLILCGVTQAMDVLVEKGVVQSLKPLSSSPHVVPSLKKKLVEYFPVYCQAKSGVHNEAKQEAFQQDISTIGPVHVLGEQTKKADASVYCQAKSGVHNEAKQEASQQDISTIGPVDVLGEQTKKADASAHAEVKCDADERFVGDHNKVVVPGVAGKVDKKSSNDSLGNISHKRKFSDVAALNDLFEVLRRSHEEAADAFEKLLLSDLSEFDKIAAERGEDRSKVGGNLKEMAKHGAESIECLAQKVPGALKESGYEFFAPLCGHSPDSLESDEIMSVTSAVFRTYIQSSHPQLLQMLLSWHSEGFAVGARFLSYACRLAEVSTPSYTSLDVDPKAGADVQSPAIHEKELDTPPLKRRKASKMSAFSWHQKSHDIENWKMGALQALEMVGRAPIHPEPAVAKAFKAYEEFLRGVKDKAGRLLVVSPFDQSKSVNGMQEKELMKKDKGDYNTDSLFLQDLETCLTWSSRKLLSILSLVFKYLPDLSRGKEQVIKMLLSVVDPVELSKFELKLSLKELSVFGQQPIRITNVIKSSLSLDCFEQQYLWRLLISELQNSTPLFVSNVVESCALFLEPARHCEAASGLLSLLRMQCPTSQLMSTMLLLPQNFGRLVAAVFAAWVSMDASRVSGCLSALAIDRSQPNKEPFKNLEQHLHLMGSYNDSALRTFSSFLDSCLEMNHEVDEKKKVEIEQIRHTVLELAEQASLKTTTDA